MANRRQQARAQTHSDPRPPTFYRVQQTTSFTNFCRDSAPSLGRSGFFTNSGDGKEFSYWLTKDKIETHLNWRARPREASPFISVFDNKADADARMWFFLTRDMAPQGTPPSVFMMEIDGSKLRQDTLRIKPANGDPIILPIWTMYEGGETTIFVSTKVMREYLGVNPRLGQLSEWFAIDHIPLSMIGTIWQ